MLPTRSGTTNRAGQRTFSFPYSVPPPGSQLGVLIEGVLEGQAQVSSVDTTCGVIQRERCTNTQLQACLSGNRFKVEGDVQTPSGAVPARVLQASKTDARFYFFNPSSTDLIIQLLQRCTFNDHYWVFYAATTNVEFDVTVTDTFNGESRAYGNETPFQPILDTAAFATCP